MRLRLVILSQRRASRFCVYMLYMRRAQHVGPAEGAEQRSGLSEDRAGTEAQ